MSLWSRFRDDEWGAIVSAELVAIGTVAVLGGTVGMNALGHSVNSELEEMAFAIRSLNQSYAVAGHTSSRAWTAGSSYTQPDVEQSLRELSDIVCDRPEPPATPKRKAPGKPKKKGQPKADADDQAFLEADESTLIPADPVSPEDDASKVETTIEPTPDA